MVHLCLATLPRSRSYQGQIPALQDRLGCRTDSKCNVRDNYLRMARIEVRCSTAISRNSRKVSMLGTDDNHHQFTGHIQMNLLSRSPRLMQCEICHHQLWLDILLLDLEQLVPWQDGYLTIRSVGDLVLHSHGPTQMHFHHTQPQYGLGLRSSTNNSRWVHLQRSRGHGHHLCGSTTVKPGGPASKASSRWHVGKVRYHIR